MTHEMRRLVLLAPLAAVAAGCGGGGARSAALVDPAKFRTCMEQPNGDELIPPGGPRNALVVMFGEYHYGQGAVMLIGGYGRSVKDGNAARGKAEQWVDEHFGPRCADALGRPQEQRLLPRRRPGPR